MSNPVAIGQLSRLGLAASSSPATIQLDFLRESLQLAEEFLDGNGLRGTLEHDNSRNRPGIQRIGGQISLQPNAVELSEILQWILGGAPTGSPTVSYPVADTLITKYVAIDRNDGNAIFNYTGVAVDRATFHANTGNILGVDLDVIAQTETYSGSWPGGLSIDHGNGPFLITDIAFSLNSTTIQVEDFRLTVDNHLNRDRFLNSLTLTAQTKLDRTIEFETRTPWGAYFALYGAANANTPAGVALSITATNGGAVLTITSSNVAIPRLSPNVAGRSENMIMWRGKCMSSAAGSTPSLSVSLNVGP